MHVVRFSLVLGDNFCLAEKFGRELRFDYKFGSTYRNVNMDMSRANPPPDLIAAVQRRDPPKQRKIDASADSLITTGQMSAGHGTPSPYLC